MSKIRDYINNIILNTNIMKHVITVFETIKYQTTD